MSKQKVVKIFGIIVGVLTLTTLLVNYPIITLCALAAQAMGAYGMFHYLEKNDKLK